MDQMARFEETLRRLAVFDEGFVRAGFGLDLARTSALVGRRRVIRKVGETMRGRSETPGDITPCSPRRAARGRALMA